MKVILAVDPGEKNIGLAKSDPLGIGATALCVISHVQMEKDARTIAEKARECGASSILVGQPLNADGSEGLKARHSAKLAEAISRYFEGEVILYDEYGSTIETRERFKEMGVRRSKRLGHLDAHAAQTILQRYLDEQYEMSRWNINSDNDAVNEESADE
ncbi:MAG: Holliday junction resolvase RuvX [Anaerolineaceae bacterium]|nr:Holliday junction resolvase RuvX [Anaerolineaceae bacterium]